MTESTPRIKRRLTKEQFGEATASLTMSVELRSAAYLIMVEGKRISEIAAATKLNDRSIQRKVRQIWLEHIKNVKALPAGWIKEEVALPAEEMKAIQKRSAELLERALIE